MTEQPVPSASKPGEDVATAAPGEGTDGNVGIRAVDADGRPQVDPEGEPETLDAEHDTTPRSDGTGTPPE